MNDKIFLVGESNWIMQDDCITETKIVIGESVNGFHFGYLDGWPDSEIHWIGTAFSSIDEAEQGRWEYETNMEIEREERESMPNPVLTFEQMEVCPF